MGAAVALKTPRFLVNAPELTFRDIPVVAAQLLFSLELNAVVGQLALAPLAMLARPVFAPIYRTFWPTPDVLAHPAVKLVLGFHALGHSRPRLSLADAEDRALLCPGRAGTERQSPRKRKALPRVAKRLAEQEIRQARGF